MSELYHHGIKGQKWGVRRYQNEDGTYTDAGKAWRMKQAGRIQKYSHGTGNVRQAKREIARRSAIRTIAFPVGGAATGAAVGALAGGPIGASIGYAAGAFIGAGAAFTNTFITAKTLDDVQSYAESSKKYADAIIGKSGSMSVEDILKK